MFVRPHKTAVIVSVIVVITIFLWTNCSLDPVLYKVGLNWGECITNNMGATFCGDAAQTYKQQMLDLGVVR